MLGSIVRQDNGCRVATATWKVAPTGEVRLSPGQSRVAHRRVQRGHLGCLRAYRVSAW